MVVKAILFDADGVVIKAEPFSTHLQRDYGIDTTTTQAFFTGPFQECILGKADLKKVIVDFLPSWGWEGTVDELLAYWFESENLPDQELIEDIKALKKRGVICCLATNQEKYRTEYIRTTMKLGKVFKEIFSSSTLGYRKPSNEYYYRVMGVLAGHHIERYEVLVVDDSESVVSAARLFGLQAYRYSALQEFRDFLASGEVTLK